ncbi:DnaJ domain-containing protein [Pelotalea chapellei]|uniref:DnaJ domain-containing protein n=1 Tax=Pelotalea chapellei TaxID=44671 RepID=A0ABS5UBY2_9BACT|nr:DnaJ domain-containing protein [Pelotalea chapellei]MBT1073187.1 DnaJ domain-containing protein [Pelotalea chapellei]
MTPRKQAELMDACRTLFPAADVTRDFLNRIRSDSLKNAYRNKVWEYHPDACANVQDADKRTERFRRSVEAYKLLNEYLKERRPTFFLRHAQVLQASSPRLNIFERVPHERYYDGPLPTIELKIGLYLYYVGAISYEAVVRAMMWQRDLRPPLGVLACKWQWLCEEDVAMILGSTQIVGSFGERAVKLGLLSASQLNILLLHQRTMQQPIGRYLVAHSLLSELSLRHYLRQLAQHNAQIQKSRNLMKSAGGDEVIEDMIYEGENDADSTFE